MTEKLFWDDPYTTGCTATVTSIDGRDVVLDRTIFFAFAGGQASDAGTIGGVPVEEAIDGDDITYVLAEKPTFKVGDSVDVKIDPARRERLRRLHSATHVVCHFWEQKSGVKEYVGSNVSPDKGRIDFAYDEPVSPQLPEVEQKANAFIAKDHSVHVENVDGTLHWQCEDIEMHCCGTHVRNTSEIGPVKLKRKNIGAGKERIEVTLAW